MNILIDIAHPAHVHLIRNTYNILIQNGHRIFVTVKDIPSAIHLLEKFYIPYIYLGKKNDSLLGKAFSQVIFNLRLFYLVWAKKIDLGFGSSLTLTHVSRISKMKSIILDDDDDDMEPLFVKYAHPFADVVLTPSCVQRNSKNRFFYDGYHELAYLHPNRFKPDPNVLNEIGLSEYDTFFVVRFNAFKAHHDVGVQGLSIDDKRKLIQLLEQKGKVFITTERNMDDEFKKYQITLSPEKIHSLIYYAKMFVGDSQTMTTEAAILGTPALKLNTFAGKLSVPNELESKYELCYSFLPSQRDAFFEKVNEIIDNKDIKTEWSGKLNKFFKDKIDVTAFYVSFIENFFKSK